MRTVALFGGSFNPPHNAHFEMARYIYKELKVDEIWLLLSVNWQKDEEAYADLEHRKAMCELIAQDYDDCPIVVSDIQHQLGTHITYNVLKELKEKHPDTQFIWVMGADNMADFHTWENYQALIEKFPIAVVDRPPYREAALSSRMAKEYAALRLKDGKDLITAHRGWILLDNPCIDLSSTLLLRQLREGKKSFEGPFQEVANYIIRNDLYNI